MTELRDLVRSVAACDADAHERFAAERELCLLLAPRIRLYGLRHLPSAGYPFLVLTFVGWIRTLLAAPSPARADDRVENPQLDATTTLSVVER